MTKIGMNACFVALLLVSKLCHSNSNACSFLYSSYPEIANEIPNDPFDSPEVPELNKIVRNTTNLEVVQTIGGSKEVEIHIYNYEIVELNNFDSILLTNYDTKEGGSGFVENIYIGIDIKDSEFDFFFLKGGVGINTNTNLLLSFDYPLSGRKCEFKTSVIADSHYLLLTITSLNSFTITHHEHKTGLKIEGAPEFRFY